MHMHPASEDTVQRCLSASSALALSRTKAPGGTGVEYPRFGARACGAWPHGCLWPSRAGRVHTTSRREAEGGIGGRGEGSGGGGGGGGGGGLQRAFGVAPGGLEGGHEYQRARGSSKMRARARIRSAQCAVPKPQPHKKPPRAPRQGLKEHTWHTNTAPSTSP